MVTELEAVGEQVFAAFFPRDVAELDIFLDIWMLLFYQSWADATSFNNNIKLDSFYWFSSRLQQSHWICYDIDMGLVCFKLRAGYVDHSSSCPVLLFIPVLAHYTTI